MNNLTFMLLLLLLLPLNLGLHPNPGLDPRQIFLEPAEAPDPHAVMVEPANLEPPELLAPAPNYLSFDGMPTFRCGTSQGAKHQRKGHENHESGREWHKNLLPKR